jgi:hypothetical protein
MTKKPNDSFRVYVKRKRGAILIQRNKSRSSWALAWKQECTLLAWRQRSVAMTKNANDSSEYVKNRIDSQWAALCCYPTRTLPFWVSISLIHQICLPVADLLLLRYIVLSCLGGGVCHLSRRACGEYLLLPLVEWNSGIR